MMWTKVIELILKPVTLWLESSASRKYMKEEGQLEITKAKVALEVAEATAKIDRLKVLDISDSDYDKQAQMERRFTLADEVLMLCAIVLVGAHFFYPERMQAGWVAMGYTGTPWWLEFIIVGVYVSVFGLMRLFRSFSPFNKNKEESKNG